MINTAARKVRLAIGYRLRVLGAIVVLAASPCFADGSAADLLRAARDGKARVAIMLAESGVDVRASGEQGETALHWAAFHGLHKLAGVLIARGASVNARVRNGNTPLHQAAYNGHLPLVELLVTNGATVDVANRRGVTATQWAQRNGHDAVLRYLIAHGGYIDPAPPALDGLEVARSLAGIRSAEPYVPKVRTQRTRAPTRAAAPAVRRLSTRLGDLPPLVLKVPEASASAGPLLVLTRELGRAPRSRVQREASHASSPPAGQRKRDSASWIQLGSFRVHAGADAAWRRTLDANQSLVSGLEPSIVSAEVGAKGTFHRLRLGPFPSADAHRLCGALQARRTACLVVAEPSLAP